LIVHTIAKLNSKNDCKLMNLQNICSPWYACMLRLAFSV
jgi:hypothetical protein